ncbi:flagellar basal body rod protein FlgC [Buchnera aphidicola (Schlechtendalia chinensis)]|uniref:Flagellar basal-body rod protein FlgC n=1 Tax=Buchnera aphidicola subsp. Schlechtendalia chinensis TaxID=118110 RepID=A0A172WDS5_BUCSC|nr:flagellar basal body rod protein FlgC [Buchnera aphidicola]ANF17087.1 flagellar basal body rod protein FlgC [Buchnera aphidicola (Schlechtendalia chinensis)]
MSLLNIFDIANSAMTAQSTKIQMHASNLANMDSLVEKNGKLYPYIAKKIIFEFDDTKDSILGGVKVKEIIEDTQTPFKKVYDPNNPISDSQGFAEISNVNIITETINAISASRAYQANLEMLNTAKSMFLKTLTIGQ